MLRNCETEKVEESCETWTNATAKSQLKKTRTDFFNILIEGNRLMVEIRS